MKISEFINNLRDVKDEYGDIQVVVQKSPGILTVAWLQVEFTNPTPTDTPPDFDVFWDYQMSEEIGPHVVQVF